MHHDLKWMWELKIVYHFNMPVHHIICMFYTFVYISWLGSNFSTSTHDMYWCVSNITGLQYNSWTWYTFHWIFLLFKMINFGLCIFWVFFFFFWSCIAIWHIYKYLCICVTIYCNVTCFQRFVSFDNSSRYFDWFIYQRLWYDLKKSELEMLSLKVRAPDKVS